MVKVWPVLLLAVVCLASCSHDGRTLPALGAHLDQTSVSGVSSGAYMAGQMQFAHAKDIVGAGLVAGGPYGCAVSWGGSMVPFWPTAVAQNAAQAFNGCMHNDMAGLGVPSADGLAVEARERAGDGKIDPVSALGDDRIYLFSGGKDDAVLTPIVQAAADLYAQLGVPRGHITFVKRAGAGHGFLTAGAGGACGASAKPFINDCGYDQAGAILRTIYPDLKSPLKTETGAPGGDLIVFDQAPYSDEDNDDELGPEGEVFVPASCARDPGCRIHIVFHGCEQSRGAVGDTFVKQSGYIRWAAVNRIIVLFPQASAGAANPKGCWDWWGYTGLDFLTREGPQITAVWKMVQRLAASPDG